MGIDASTLYAGGLLTARVLLAEAFGIRIMDCMAARRSSILKQLRNCNCTRGILINSSSITF